MARGTGVLPVGSGNLTWGSWPGRPCHVSPVKASAVWGFLA